MEDRQRRRRTAPKRTLIGPLLMLVGGMAAGGLLWHLLMLEPSPADARLREQLTRQDQQALNGLLATHP